MAKFTCKDKYYGFDEAANWHMIPVAGLRNVILEDGANMTVTLKDPDTGSDLSPGVATMTELTRQDQNKREITIIGFGAGKGLLRADDPRNPGRKAKLKLGILEKVYTDIDFYVLSDDNNSSTSNPSLFPGWVEEATSLFINPLTNVTVYHKNSSNLKLKYDFGAEVDAFTLIQELKKQASWDETYPSVIMVWKLKKKGEAYKDTEVGGFTNPPFILVADTSYNESVRKLLAHEISHFFLGPTHHDNKINLLHDKYYLNGVDLTKEQMIEFNRLKPKKWVITE